MSKIKKEYKLEQLEQVFYDMNNNKTKIGLDLLEEAYFIKKTLKKLKKEIDKSEVVGEMQQGSYSINRTNPAIKTYNTTIGNYQKIMKQLTDLLPVDDIKKSDGFNEFGDDE